MKKEEEEKQSEQGGGGLEGRSCLEVLDDNPKPQKLSQLILQSEGPERNPKIRVLGGIPVS